MGSINDEILSLISDNSEREMGKPALRENFTSSQNDRLLEFIVLSVSSMIVSFVPICLMALLESIQESYWSYVFSNPDVLFTVTTLMISVVCEIYFTKSKSNQVIGATIPFLIILIIWSMGAYVCLRFAQPNTYGEIYTIPIICITLVFCLVFSIFAIYLADRPNRKSNK